MVTATFPGRLAEVARICEFVSKNAVTAGLDDMAVYSVELAVDEACTNIIEHAYGGDGKGEIECSCEILPNGFKVVLRDFGRSFNPDKVPAHKPKARLQEVKARGAGLYLIRKMMDEVSFEFSQKEGNRLTLFKRR
jgi:serine/threonine-protein kinase RsbW